MASPFSMLGMLKARRASKRSTPSQAAPAAPADSSLSSFPTSDATSSTAFDSDFSDTASIISKASTSTKKEKKKRSAASLFNSLTRRGSVASVSGASSATPEPIKTSVPPSSLAVASTLSPIEDATPIATSPPAFPTPPSAAVEPAAHSTTSHPELKSRYSSDGFSVVDHSDHEDGGSGQHTSPPAGSGAPSTSAPIAEHDTTLVPRGSEDHEEHQEADWTEVLDAFPAPPPPSTPPAMMTPSSSSVGSAAGRALEAPEASGLSFNDAEEVPSAEGTRSAAHEALLRNLNAEIEKLKEQVWDLEISHADRGEQLQRARDGLRLKDEQGKALNEEIERAKDGLRLKDEHAKVLGEELERLRSGLSSKEEELKGLHKEFDRLKEVLRQTGCQLDDVKADSVQKDNTIRTLNAEVDELQSRLTSLEADRVRMGKEMDVLKVREGQLANEVQRATSIQSTLTAELLGMKRRLEEEEVTVEEKKRRIEELERTLEARDGRIAELEGTVEVERAFFEEARLTQVETTEERVKRVEEEWKKRYLEMKGEKETMEEKAQRAEVEGELQCRRLKGEMDTQAKLAAGRIRLATLQKEEAERKASEEAERFNREREGLIRKIAGLEKEIEWSEERYTKEMMEKDAVFSKEQEEFDQRYLQLQRAAQEEHARAMESMRRDVDAKDKEIESLKRERAAWQRDGKEMASKAEDKIAELEEQKAEMYRLGAKRARDQMQASEKAKAEHLEAMEREIVNLRQGLSDLANLRVESKRKDKLILDLKSQVADAQERPAQLDTNTLAKIDSLQQRLKSTNNALVQSERRSAQLQATIGNLQRKLAEAQERDEARGDRVVEDQWKRQSSDTPFIRQPDRPRGGVWVEPLDAARAVVVRLNDEVFQFSATLADGITNDTTPGEDMVDLGLLTKRLEPMLSQELVARLRDVYTNTSVEADHLLLQIAIQGCVVYCCDRFIRSWYPFHWDYGVLLKTMYSRLLESGSAQMADSWRASTRPLLRLTSESHPQLVAYLRENVLNVLAVVGRSPSDPDTEALLRSTEEKISYIARLAIRMHILLSDTPSSSNLETFVPVPGTELDRNAMEDMYADEVKADSRIASNKLILCTSEIGIQRVSARYGRDDVVFKPKVILRPFLYTDV